MQLIEVRSIRDRHRFRKGLAIGMPPDDQPDWFDQFDELLRSSRRFQPYLQRTPHKRWLLRDRGVTIGRIMAMQPSEGPSRFGFYNCIDEPEAVRILTDAVVEWSRSRGCQELIGPFNPSIHTECGLLESRSCPALYGYPDTPPHYIQNLERCGFRPAKRLLTFLQSDERNAIRLQQRMAPVLEKIDQHGLQLEEARWSTLQRDTEWVETLINACWRDNWGFEPISRAEARQIVLQVLTLLPEGVLSFISLHQRPVAISLGIPNAREIASRLSPRFSFLNLPVLFLRLRRMECEHGRVALLGVIPELQGSQLSLMATIAMLSNLIRKGLSFGGSSASMGWILEDNQAMLRFLKLYGGEHVMTHVIMAKHLGRPGNEKSPSEALA